MKVEKKEFVVGSIVGIIIGGCLGIATMALLDMVRENNQYNEYQKELEFHEQVRTSLMNYRSTLELDSSEYFFEKRFDGKIYLVWLKFNDLFSYFDYNYARLGQ